jgi:hypothetical protein
VWGVVVGSCGRGGAGRPRVADRKGGEVVQESYGGGEFGQGSKVARVSNVVFAHALNRRSGGNRNWPIGVGGVPMPRWGGASVAPTFICVSPSLCSTKT